MRNRQTEKGRSDRQTEIAGVTETDRDRQRQTDRQTEIGKSDGDRQTEIGKSDGDRQTDRQK